MVGTPHASTQESCEMSGPLSHTCSTFNCALSLPWSGTLQPISQRWGLRDEVVWTGEPDSCTPSRPGNGSWVLFSHCKSSQTSWSARGDKGNNACAQREFTWDKNAYGIWIYLFSILYIHFWVHFFVSFSHWNNHTNSTIERGRTFFKLAADVSSANSVALHAAGLSLFFILWVLWLTMLNKVPEHLGVRACYGLSIMHNKQHLNRCYQLSGLVVWGFQPRSSRARHSASACWGFGHHLSLSATPRG